MTVDIDLRVEWLRQIAAFWDDYNHEYLDDSLRSVSFRLTDSRSELGRWLRIERVIEISAHHVLAAPWSEVMLTLRHEMAHQFADEVLLATHEAPHGPSFRSACRLLRIDPAASGRLDGERSVPDPEADRVLRLIEKLLALGGSPNENEATAAMRKARQLMLEHNLGVAGSKRDRIFGCKVLGKVRKRHPSWELTLGGLLARFFFVQAIWAPYFDAVLGAEGTALHIYGTPDNLAMAEYVHGYLSQVVDDLWRRYKEDRGVRGDRQRLQYLDGVLLGFRDKLKAQEREIVATDSALVWKGDPMLESFYRWHNPRVRGGGGRSIQLTDARAAGREAGRNLALHRPITERGTTFGGLLGE